MKNKSGDPPITVVEHIVLFKTKDGVPPSKIHSFQSKLLHLKHLHGIYHFHAGTLIKSRPDDWMLALHGRYRDQHALNAYAVHPLHLQVVAEGNDIMDDKLSVDWESSLDADAVDTDYGAVRFVAIKWTVGVTEEQIAELIQALGNFPGIKQATAGPNFCSRAKGFQWGFIAQFATIQELEELQATEKQEGLLQSPLVESFVVVDF